MIENFYAKLADRFFHLNENTPYNSEQGYIDDCMALISGYLHLAITIRAETSPEDGLFLRGLPFDPQWTIAYLAEYDQKSFPCGEDVINCLLSAENKIIKKLLISDADGFRFMKLKSKLNLNDFAYFSLLFSYGCATDRAFESAFAMLHEDDKLGFPTLQSIYTAYTLIKPAPSIYDLNFCDAGTITSLLYSEMPPSTNNSLTYLKLSPHAVAYLSGRDFSVNVVNYRLINGSVEDEPRFIESQIDMLSQLMDKENSFDVGSIIALNGEMGSGRKLTLHKLSQKHKKSFLIIPSYSLDKVTASELILYSLLEGYNLCFEDVDTDNIPQITKIEQLLHILAPFNPLVVLLTCEMRYSFELSGYTYLKIDYPLPSQKESLAHWKCLAEQYEVEEDVDWYVITAKYKLTPGQMKNALTLAAVGDGDSKINLPTLANAILQTNTGRLSELADMVHCFYDWDDLVLSASSKQLLLNVCNRIKYKYKVEEEWGFKKKSAYGNGVSVLLYGPPGTGKTMSAQVLSKELGLPLYRINLSQITSKYIGETAKNLNRIFEEAKKTNAILFFDEADALFSKRTEVSNSNDRHANSEVSYLLQKIEEFSGVSILATNLANNFDDAFRRRINYIINIHMPSPEERLNLWKSNFPPSAPLSEDVDFDMLSESLDFSGSVIKSAATQAAYFAAADNDEVSMIHIARAVRAELLKLGKAPPHFLSIYPE